MIDKIRKEMTREEFVKIVDTDKNYSVNYNGHCYNCPSDLGLVDTCSNNSCMGCWKHAINHIKFKGEEEMKTYQTWEVIKMITEDSTLEFKDKHNRTLKLDGNGDITILNNVGEDIKNHFLKTTIEWELVEKEVPFMDAVQAFDEGKTIECELSCGRITYDGGLKALKDTMGLGVSPEEILDGKWYIREA